LKEVEAESSKVSQRFLREQNYIKKLEKQVVLLQKRENSTFQHFQGQQIVLETGTNTQESMAGTTMVSLLDQNGIDVLTAWMPESCNIDTTPNSTSISGGMKSPDSGVQSGLHWQNLALINPLANHQMAIDFVLR
jgi:hypothetical protein